MGPDINQILSEQLRDIHVPEAIGWWPLAIGWWLLLALVILMLVAGIWAFLQHLKRQRYRHLAVAELDQAFMLWQENQNTALFIQSTNQILKRALTHGLSQAMAKDFSHNELNTHGETWAAYLKTLAPDAFDQQSLEALASGGYQKDYQTDAEKLYRQTTDWLRSHSLNASKKGSRTLKGEVAHA